jgi:phasin family protein
MADSVKTSGGTPRKGATTKVVAKPVPAIAPASKAASAIKKPAPAKKAAIATPAKSEVATKAPMAKVSSMKTPPPPAPAFVENIIESVSTPAVSEYNVEARPVETEKTPIEVTSPVALEGTNTMSDIIENTKKFADDAKVRLQGAFAEMSEKAKVGVEKSTKAVEELGDLAKGNVEALVESGKIAAKGMETLGQDATEYGRMTFEKATAAMKSLAAAKTPAEFFQLQTELVSSNFDAFAKATAKNSEALMKLAGEIVQPLSTRASIVTEKVKSLAA